MWDIIKKIALAPVWVVLWIAFKRDPEGYMRDVVRNIEE